MLATEQATRLLTRLAIISQAADEALRAVENLDEAGGVARRGEGGRWLPGIKASLRRIQVECADLHYAALELRDGLPSSSTLQPRLLD